MVDGKIKNHKVLSILKNEKTKSNCKMTGSNEKRPITPAHCIQTNAASLLSLIHI